MRPPKSFLELTELSKEIHILSSVESVLHWDQDTHMPPGSIAPRIDQIALLSTLVHEKRTSRKFKELIGKLASFTTGEIKVKGLSKANRICVREWLKDFLRETRLPASFVREFSQVTSEATQVWATAKKENNFHLFAPFLSKIVDLSRKKADLLGFEEHPYDALLEGYEPSMTTRRVTEIFHGLQKELKGLLKKIDAKKQIDDDFLRHKLKDETQWKIARHFMGILPMEKEYCRLDLSAHPFSTAFHPHDTRITTRFLPDGFMSNIFSVLHEAGHSMYEMGLPVDTWGTPLSETVSLSVHESQSRWWETLIGRSLPFWKGQYPFLKKTLPFLKNVPLEKFYRAINKVEPSLTRVEADEVTYGLHVILRFELEQALITGKLSVSELPEAWNAKTKELLGITVPNDAKGCLQDIHWSMGSFGYFPTYALGNILAAQFFTAFEKKHSDWEKKVAAGDFAFIRAFLRKNIHCLGRTYHADQLAKRISGKPLSETAYCSYLKDKYAQVYHL